MGGKKIVIIVLFLLYIFCCIGWISGDDAMRAINFVIFALSIQKLTIMKKHTLTIIYLLVFLLGLFCCIGWIPLELESAFIIATIPLFLYWYFSISFGNPTKQESQKQT